MDFVLKAAGIVIYALGLAGLAGLLPAGGFSTTMQWIAAVVLFLHILEAIFMFKYVKLYKGPLLVSIFLTLLFGANHWKP
ncbi:MAG: hypothetical protein PHR35_22285, partial [Kiritimatiellae bacterium]|nr:hypothetical protein [Kiritimatiellia bacterium]